MGKWKGDREERGENGKWVRGREEVAREKRGRKGHG